MPDPRPLATCDAALSRMQTERKLGMVIAATVAGTFSRRCYARGGECSSSRQQMSQSLDGEYYACRSESSCRRLHRTIRTTMRSRCFRYIARIGSAHRPMLLNPMRQPWPRAISQGRTRAPACPATVADWCNGVTNTGNGVQLGGCRVSRGTTWQPGRPRSGGLLCMEGIVGS